MPRLDRVGHLFRMMSIADAFTLSNAVCGIFSIIALLLLRPDITLATGFIFIGMIFDGVDGAAARRFGTLHDKGRYLDSMADAITFVLAPAVMLLVVYFPIGGSGGQSIAIAIMAVAAAVALVVFGWTRLYRFTTEQYQDSDFTGLATPALAFLVMMICHLLPPARAHAALIALSICALAAVMAVAPVKYPKLRGMRAILLSVAISCSMAGIVALKWWRVVDAEHIWLIYRGLTISGIGLLVFYSIIYPLLLHFATGSDAADLGIDALEIGLGESDTDEIGFQRPRYRV